MLAGAYSNQFRAMERQQVEVLKTLADHDKTDSIARAKKLSIETNKRRRALAIKRKAEAEREEKRRKQILAKRREKQQDATERYQRAHMPSRPNSASGRFSPKHQRTTLEEALRLVRGGSARTPNANTGRSPQTTPTGSFYRQNSDPLNKPYFNKYAHPPSPANRTPDSGKDNQSRDDMRNRSLWNLNSSRSLFEQQLQSHQKNIIDQQQKSLREFNNAIRKEINADESEIPVADVPLVRSESLSSVDSLEDTESNDTLKDSCDLDSFGIALNKDFEIPNNTKRGGVTSNSSTQTKPGLKSNTKVNGKPPTGIIPFSPVVNGSPSQGPYSSTAATPVSEGRIKLQQGASPVVNRDLTSVQKQDLAYQLQIQEQKEQFYQQRQKEIQRQLEQQQQQNLLQQQQQQKIAQQQQQLLQQKLEIERKEQQFLQEQQQQKQLQQQQQQVQPPSVTSTTNTTQGEGENFRPKVQMKAWGASTPDQAQPMTSVPSSVVQNLVTNASPYTGRNTMTNVTKTTVTMYEKIPSNSSKLTTAMSGQLQNGSNDSVVSQPTSGKSVKINGTSSAAAQPSSAPQKLENSSVANNNGSFLETVTNGLTKQQGAASAYSNTSVNNSSTPQRSAQLSNTTTTTSTNPGYYLSTYASKLGGPSEMVAVNTSKINGSVVQGTLGLVDGQLAVVNGADLGPPQGPLPDLTDTGDTDSVSTIAEEKEPEVKEVKSILKKSSGKTPPKAGILKKSGSTGNMRSADVRDSLEITRVHLQTCQEDKAQRTPKKNVRFADLTYDEPEDENGDDDDEKLFIKRHKGPAALSHKPPRPMSAAAKMHTHTTKTDVTAQNHPRASSASTTRTSSIPRAKTQIVRPQAAAHIITQPSPGSHGSSGLENGLNSDKKITVVNNDFMEKIPAMLRAQNNGQPIHTVTPASVFAMTSVNYNRPAEQKGTYAVSSIMLPKSEGSAPFIYTNGYPNKSGPSVPSSSSQVPSYSNAGQGLKYEGAVYDENGVRIDRTPTDDEINFLWDKVRNCLSRNTSATPEKTPISVSAIPDSQLSTARQAAPLSHKVIDGNALGQYTSLNRVANNQQPVYTSPGLRRQNSTESAGGYSKRYGLLQRKQQPNPNSLKSRQQQQQQPPLQQQQQQQQQGYTVYHAPVQSNMEPTSAVPTMAEMTESMAQFLAAETLADQAFSDSKIQQVVDDPQSRQQVLSATRPSPQKSRSALSIEEQKLLESLDRLNEKLRITENNLPSNNPGNHTTQAQSQTPPQPQQYIHRSSFILPNGKVGGFKGHTPILSAQRRAADSANQKARLRITSANLSRHAH